MGIVPEKVKVEYERLKKEYPFYVALKQINGKYYLYKQTSRTDENKKVKVTTEYLGRVIEDGTFMRKVVSKNVELENAKAIIMSRGGKVILPEKTDEGTFVPTKELTHDEIDQKILTTLSMNARASLAFMGRKISLSQTATYNRVKQLEKRYGIRYLVEVDIEKLGYLKFLIMVKFIDVHPPVEELKNAIEKEPRVQLAFLTNGDYDLVLYGLVRNVQSEEAIDIVASLRTGALAKYKSVWYTVPFYEHFGFIPLRNDFINFIKKDLLKREYAILKELNNNGILDFTEIDKKHGFDPGSSRYTYYKLKERGVLRRITITLQNAPIRYMGMIFKELVDEEQFRKNRVSSLMNIIEETTYLTDKYCLTGDIGNPDGSLLFMPVYSNNDLDLAVEKLVQLDLGIKIKTLVVTSIILGSFCYRKYDYVHSKQHHILVQSYGHKQEEKINYEETGRKINIKGRDERFNLKDYT